MSKIEDKRIEKALEQYRGILDRNDMDICHSAHGRWYVSRYNTQDEQYDFFIEFQTAEQLTGILFGDSSDSQRLLDGRSSNLRTTGCIALCVR